VVAARIRESRLTVAQAEQDNLGAGGAGQRAYLASAEAQLAQGPEAQQRLPRVTLGRNANSLWGRVARFAASRWIKSGTASDTRRSRGDRPAAPSGGGPRALALAPPRSLNPSIRAAQLQALGDQRQRALSRVLARRESDVAAVRRRRSSSESRKRLT